MHPVAQYLLKLVCAGILTSLVMSIGGEHGCGGGIRKLVCGVFLTLVLIEPLRMFDPEDLTNPLEDYSAMAQAASDAGMTQAREAMISHISQQSAAYILDKADEMGAQIQVEVEVDPDTFYPVFATMTGAVTPFEKETLSGFLEENLLIERSAQRWRN